MLIIVKKFKLKGLKGDMIEAVCRVGRLSSWTIGKVL
ncbi:hypothetical protein QO000_004155 [Alkalihalobacillus hemicentroti]|uniref:Uncharacterized protein n=1 Tax=Guptibacillus hwajinpoensis TaxID=208199 RepID=A0ABU0K9E0_9BACL|nr:hypothetical protein [Alkalihalobacillus hemicentroti]